MMESVDGTLHLGRRKKGRIPKSIWVRAAYSFLIVAGIVLVGTLGMHSLEGWSYLDCFYFTAFLATGQGPPGNLIPSSDASKLFVSVLAFVSVGSVITSLLFLFGPFLGEVFRAGEERFEDFEKYESRERAQKALTKKKTESVDASEGGPES